MVCEIQLSSQSQNSSSTIVFLQGSGVVAHPFFSVSDDGRVSPLKKINVTDDDNGHDYSGASTNLAVDY